MRYLKLTLIASAIVLTGCSYHHHDHDTRVERRSGYSYRERVDRYGGYGRDDHRSPRHAPHRHGRHHAHRD